ncbi:MAG: hypothetical protein HKN16_13575 [Saprospiraceae bacterium]|nr:hypothetical protein [Saprospiraceae bacterium]
MDPSTDNRTFYHQEHREWLSTLDFYQDEIKFFQNELALILHANMSSMSILEHADEYKLIFRKKLETLDELRHSIVKHDGSLADNSKDDVGIDTSHDHVRKEYETFKENFDLMKQNFKRFAAKND